MKKRILTFKILACLSIFSILSCDNDETLKIPVFKWSEQYIAGKISPKSSPDRYSSYAILLNDDKSGQLITATKVFEGKYEEKTDSLIFTTTDQEKWFVFRVNDNKISSSHYEVRFYKKDGTYKPAPVKYTTTFYQESKPKKNQILGNTYVGDLYKMFSSGVYQKGYIIQFDASGHAYQSGNIDHIHYKTFGNVAFRSEQNGRKEFGVLVDDTLIISATDEKGFSYWGTFTKQ